MFIPAFSGLSAPYWNNDVRACLMMMDRNIGKAEIVKAAVECIANQVADIAEIMEETYGESIEEIRADGGPTENRYLMSYQSGITNMRILISETKELSLLGSALAANVVFKSDVQLWQVPRNVYRMMPVSFAEMYDKVYPCGEIGKYLVENVIAFNNEGISRPVEHRGLGDSPAIGIIMFNDCGEWEYRPAPVFDEKMNYVHTGKYRPIKVYKNIDNRFILEDLYAKLKLFCS